MKTSLRRLRGFALHRNHDSKDKSNHNYSHSHRHRHHQEQQQQPQKRPIDQFDELARASMDMNDMRSCYDSLFSAAAAIANSAYEFSESLREIGTCLLEKTALNDDEESGRVLLMLGKVQFELHKVVDDYEMKRQCDEKRNLYEYMRARQKDKGRSRSGKESFSSQELQEAHDDFDEEATLFVFRLKSLKQGQSRSLLTQAARHHAAQLSFFRKALKSLEAIEPHVKLVAEQQHIDYQFKGLDDEEGEDADDDDDGELSFDYGQCDSSQESVSPSRSSMQLDAVDITFPQVAAVDSSKDISGKQHRNSFSFSDFPKTISQSAPLFPDMGPDPEKIKQLRQSSTRKYYTYVLPTPVDTKTKKPAEEPSKAVPQTPHGPTHKSWHSNSLEEKKNDKNLGDENISGPTILNIRSIVGERNKNTMSTGMPPLAEGLSPTKLEAHAVSDAKKMSRHAFSGPLIRNPDYTKPSPSGPRSSSEHLLPFSGPILRGPPRSSSPKVSPSTSPPFMSSPRISELHELPRPPSKMPFRSTRPTSLIGHSEPLSRGRELPYTSNHMTSNTASPLPAPPQTVTRSFSIPSRGQGLRERVHMPTLTEAHSSEMTEAASSPPLTLISLTSTPPVLAASVSLLQDGQRHGCCYCMSGKGFHTLHL
ncbi:hypothetical protein RJ641_002557 [Dillenia turbinata]|uniref:BAR domain-containing protein n=1 Tax=Dillenia turbinata TaxID=194707 RepID=A0AAN8Z8M3_9MAGN